MLENNQLTFNYSLSKSAINTHQLLVFYPLWHDSYSKTLKVHPFKANETTIVILVLTFLKKLLKNDTVYPPQNLRKIRTSRGSILEFKFAFYFWVWYAAAAPAKGTTQQIGP